MPRTNVGAAEGVVGSMEAIMQKAPWNKGRLTGQKRPLKPKDVWAIRVRLQLQHRARDLALFNLAIDSKLRGCNLVRLQVDDVCAAGRVRDRASSFRKRQARRSSSKEGDEELPHDPIGGASPALLLHVDPSEVLEPTLRAEKALHLLAHGSRVQIVNDEQPRRIVDDDLVCLADVGGDLFGVG